ncbi:MAG TPA: hypothetical protein VFP23_06415 [Solirubrobacterales bacterium]|nr:hypothetical protein [Solirubrobacterales bacterium]
MIAAAAALLPLSLTACGGSEASSDSGETAASYPVQVVGASFPARQRLGQTSLLRVGVRNSGRRTIPALTVTISIAGREGQASSLPFGIRSPQPGLARPDRPVWVLNAKYPRLAGASISAGAEGSAHKTFDFGPLKPGATTDVVWKLSAVRAGRYTLLFRVGAGLGGKARAVGAGGVAAGGSLTAQVSAVPPELTVSGSGKVVEIQKGKGAGEGG